MCTYSMVLAGKIDDWDRRYVQPLPPYVVPQPVLVPQPYPVPVPCPYVPQMPSQQEIDEFRRLLERAREYDKKNKEPDCENEEKRQKIRDLAKQLGVDVSFV